MDNLITTLKTNNNTYFSTDNGVLLQGDCLDKLKVLPDNSVDLIPIDIPYNIGKDTWDKIDNYIEWMGEVFKECERVLKDNGSFYFFHNDFMQIVELQNWLSKNTSFVFKQLITWNKIDTSFKNHGYVQQRLSVDMMRNYYNGFTEYCLFYTLQEDTGLEKIMPNIFEDYYKYMNSERKRLKLSVKDIEAIFNGKSIVHKWFERTQPRLINEINLNELSLKTNGFKIEHAKLIKMVDNKRAECEHLRYTFNNTRVKEDLRGNSNMWLYPPAKQNGHITPKPLDLIKNIILHSSNENDIVLDCFSGSGTLAVACEELHRNWICIEREEKYCEITKERIINLK